LSEERRGGEVRVKEVMGREESETALLGGQMKIFIKTIGSIGRNWRWVPSLSLSLLSSPPSSFVAKEIGRRDETLWGDPNHHTTTPSNLCPIARTRRNLLFGDWRGGRSRRRWRGEEAEEEGEEGEEEEEKERKEEAEEEERGADRKWEQEESKSEQPVEWGGKLPWIGGREMKVKGVHLSPLFTLVG
jgi:hypothetical protein